MPTAIVSGVTGHLGSELARQLRADGTTVHGLSRSNASGHPTVHRVSLHTVDGSTDRLISILDEIQPEVAFHLAGLTRRAHQSRDISPFIEANIHFGTQLLEATCRCACPHFITAGTYLQHFKGERGGSMNLYAATRDAFETILQYYVDAFNITAARLTLCDIYSERDTRRKLMTDIADACASNGTLSLVNPDARVDLVHVEDAARAFIRAATLVGEGAVKTHDVARYSVTSGQDITVREIICLFERISGKKLVIQRKDTPRLLRDMGPWRGTRIPGWSPQISLEEGIERMLIARSGGSA